MLEVTAFLSRQMPWSELHDDLLAAVARAMEVHFIAQSVRLTNVDPGSAVTTASPAAAQPGDRPVWPEGSLVVVRQGCLWCATAYSGGDQDRSLGQTFVEHKADTGATVFWSRSPFGQSRVPIAQWLQPAADSLVYILPPSAISTLAKNQAFLSAFGVGLGPHLDWEQDTLRNNANSASLLESDRDPDPHGGPPQPSLNALLDLGSAMVERLETGEKAVWNWAPADASVRDVIDVIGRGATRVVLPGDGTNWGLTERLVVGPDELMRWLAGPMPSDFAPAQSIASNAHLARLGSDHMLGLLTGMAERKACYALLIDNHDVSSVFSLEQIVARCDKVVDRLAARLAMHLITKAPLSWAGPALVRLGCSNPLAAGLLASWLHNTLIRQACLDHEQHKGRAPSQYAVVVPGRPAMLEMLPELCQSHVIVHEPTPFSFGDTSWFVQLGVAITARLKEAGFIPPDQGFVCSDPFWVQTTTTWRTWMDGWAARPDPTSAKVARDFPVATTAHGNAFLTKDLKRGAESMHHTAPATGANPGRTIGPPDVTRMSSEFCHRARELADHLWHLSGSPDVEDQIPMSMGRLLAVAETDVGSKLTRSLLHDLGTGLLWATAKSCSAGQPEGQRLRTVREGNRARKRDEYHISALAAMLEQCFASLKRV